MKLRATVEYEVDPKDYINQKTGILEVPIEKQDKCSILELLSEVYHSITNVKVEEIND